MDKKQRRAVKLPKTNLTSMVKGSKQSDASAIAVDEEKMALVMQLVCW